MTKLISQAVTACAFLVIPVGHLVADEPTKEPAKALQVGDTAEQHLGTDVNDQPLLLSTYRGKRVLFACVDHHK